MAEEYPSDQSLINMMGTAQQNHPMPALDVEDWYTVRQKLDWFIAQALSAVMGCQVYKDDTDDDRIGVRAGKFMDTDGVTLVSYAGETNHQLTNNQTCYVYLYDNAGTWEVAHSTTAFPVPSVTPHIRLATIVVAAGSFDAEDVVDRRGDNFLRPLTGTTTLQTLDWQESVADELDFTSAEPASPSVGDRYINTGSGASSETGQTVAANDIEVWNGTDWTEITPTEGACLMVEDRDMLVGFNGSAWADIGTFALLTEAQTFFAATDITGAEAETLTDGSNADAKHVHTADTGLSDLTATAAEINAVCDDCTATAAEITAACDGFSGSAANLTEASTFFGATDISGAEAETLTDGSNADAKHVHTADTGLSDLTATAAEINAVCDDCTATAAEITAACDGFSGSAANLTEASTFFGATDISGAEAETLTDGSNADALHVHDTAGIAADAIDKTKIAADVAGDGLAQAAGGEMDVSVDDNTIETNAGTLRLKDNGVTFWKLNGVVKDAMPDLNITSGGEVGDVHTVTVQARDAVGNDLAERVLARVWVDDAEYGAPDATGNTVAITTGTQMRQITANGDYEIISDAGGTIVITLTVAGDATRYVMAEIDGRIYSSGALSFTA